MGDGPLMGANGNTRRKRGRVLEDLKAAFPNEEDQIACLTWIHNKEYPGVDFAKKKTKREAEVLQGLGKHVFEELKRNRSKQGLVIRNAIQHSACKTNASNRELAGMGICGRVKASHIRSGVEVPRAIGFIPTGIAERKDKTPLHVQEAIKAFYICFSRPSPDEVGVWYLLMKNEDLMELFKCHHNTEGAYSKDGYELEERYYITIPTFKKYAPANIKTETWRSCMCQLCKAVELCLLKYAHLLLAHHYEDYKGAERCTARCPHGDACTVYKKVCNPNGDGTTQDGMLQHRLTKETITSRERSEKMGVPSFFCVDKAQDQQHKCERGDCPDCKFSEVYPLCHGIALEPKVVWEAMTKKTENTQQSRTNNGNRKDTYVMETRSGDGVAFWEYMKVLMEKWKKHRYVIYRSRLAKQKIVQQLHTHAPFAGVCLLMDWTEKYVCTHNDSQTGVSPPTIEIMVVVVVFWTGHELATHAYFCVCEEGVQHTAVATHIAIKKVLLDFNEYARTQQCGPVQYLWLFSDGK